MLGREAVVFDYAQNIMPGVDWSDHISQRIAAARATILIVTRRTLDPDSARPELFELINRIPVERLFVVALDRMPLNTLPSELVKAKQLDFIDLAYVGEGFAKSERYIDFQDRVRSLADAVATSIERGAIPSISPSVSAS